MAQNVPQIAPNPSLELTPAEAVRLGIAWARYQALLDQLMASRGIDGRTHALDLDGARFVARGEDA